MFERVIADTIQRITAETLQERAVIPLADLLQDTRIPSRLKPFFETEVHWWLYNEALVRAANKRFDHDHPEVAALVRYLEQVQFRHARFEREEFLAVLDSAVKLTYNYLCRPQTTLKWYIFRGQPVKPLTEVLLRFGAFVDYPYFRDVFIDWVERKRAERPTFDAISAIEFERVIRRIDDQILLNCSVEGLLDLMDPLFDFIGEGTEQLVPVDALVIFFDDKNIKKLVDQLDDHRERGLEVVGREGFVALLDELLSTSEDEEEADFSGVYQNDALDDVVRQHLEGSLGALDLPYADPPAHQSGAYQRGAYQGSEGRFPDPGHDVPDAGTAAPPADGGPAASVPVEPIAPMASVTGDDESGHGDEPYQPAPYDETPYPPGSGPRPDWPGSGNADRTADHRGPGSHGTPHGGMETANLYSGDATGDGANIGNTPYTASYRAWNSPEHAGVAAHEDGDVLIAAAEPEFSTPAEAPYTNGVAAYPADAGAPTDLYADAAEAENPELEHPEAIHPEAEDPEEDLFGEPAEAPIADAVMVAEMPVVDDAEDDAIDLIALDDDAEVAPSALRMPPDVAGPQEADDEPEPIVEFEDGDAPILMSPPAPVADTAAGSETGAQGLADVRGFIDPALERKVIKKVFARNRMAYEAALERLNGAAAWRGAAQILEEIFSASGVDPYSRTAIRFTDSVYGRYLGPRQH